MAAHVVCVAAVAVFPAPQAQARDSANNCNALVFVGPEDASLTGVDYRFRVSKTVGTFSESRNAARDARRRIVDCVTAHWVARFDDNAPAICRSGGSYLISDYPFTAMYQRILKHTCDANAGTGWITADVELYIFGPAGCEGRDSSVPVATLARRLGLDCAPMPPVNRVDELPPEEEDGLLDREDAWPSGLVLEERDLPGNDISEVVFRGADWTVCQSACSDHATCRAWTYVASPKVGGPAACRLKRGISAPVRCPLCTSGVR